MADAGYNPQRVKKFSALNCSLTFSPHSTQTYCLTGFLGFFLSSLVHTKSEIMECDALLLFIKYLKGNINMIIIHQVLASVIKTAK